jgi:hypothetical protein
MLYCVGSAWAQVQGVADVGDEIAQPDRQQHAAEAAGGEAVGHIADPVEDQDPHAEEMPLQPVLRPRAGRDRIRKTEPAEQHVVVIDLPSARDHDEHRDRVGPMHDPDRQRMQPPRMCPGMGG